MNFKEIASKAAEKIGVRFREEMPLQDLLTLVQPALSAMEYNWSTSPVPRAMKPGYTVIATEAEFQVNPMQPAGSDLSIRLVILGHIVNPKGVVSQLPYRLFWVYPLKMKDVL